MSVFHKNKLLKLFESDSTGRSNNKDDIVKVSNQNNNRKTVGATSSVGGGGRTTSSSSSSTTTTTSSTTTTVRAQKVAKVTSTTVTGGSKAYSSSEANLSTKKTTAAGELRSPRPATNLSQAISGPPGKRTKRRKIQNSHADKQPLTEVKPMKVSKRSSGHTQSQNVNIQEPQKGPKKAKKKGGQKKGSEVKERLEGARFRYLNEMLYTSHSKEAMAAFRKDPTSFEVYHQGYRRQIEKWPVKPIDLAIGYIKSRPKGDVIADLGCGDAKIAATVAHKVHSFDIRAINDRVIVADMAKLPLPDEAVNVVVYCLSLMGTNLVDFLQEAHRVLVDGGVVWIAEVASRFDRDIKAFSESVESVGFKCSSCKTDMSHFVTLTFKKTKPASLGGKAKRGRVDISLAPCLYKKR